MQITPTKAAGARSSQTFLRWPYESSPYVVEFEAGLLHRLLTETRKAQESGHEIGGLLVGSIAKAAKLTLRIEGFEPVARDAGGSPAYRLSVQERARLSAARKGLIDKSAAVLGFFRTHDRPGPMVLTEDDRALFSSEFRRAIHIALLIQASKPYRAAMFAPDLSGSITAASPFAEVELDDAEIAGLAKSICAAPSPVIESPPGEDDAVATRGRGRWLDTGSRAVQLGIVTLMISLVVALCLTFGGRFVNSVLVRDRALDLTVRGGGELVEVRWNQGAPVIEGSRGGTLTIRDGASEWVRALSREELQRGAVVYEPRSRAVRFRLSIILPQSARFEQSADWMSR